MAPLRGALAAKGSANQRGTEHEARGGSWSDFRQRQACCWSIAPTRRRRRSSSRASTFATAIRRIRSARPTPLFRSAAAAEGNAANRLRCGRHFRARSQIGANSVWRRWASTERFDGPKPVGIGVLAGGMKLTTPEPRLNDMYKQMVLSTVSNVIKNPGTTWTTPEHCPMLPNAIWPWEFSAVAHALDSLGYHKDVRPCLQYFVEHQSGVGRWARTFRPTARYCAYRALSRAIVGWMNETGSVLWIFADHYRYSCDAERPKANRPPFWPPGSGSEGNEAAPGCTTTRQRE